MSLTHTFKFLINTRRSCTTTLPLPLVHRLLRRHPLVTASQTNFVAILKFFL